MLTDHIYAAIYGDIIGSSCESKDKLLRDQNLSIDDLERRGQFTDDTVLTIATLDALKNEKDFFTTYVKWGNEYKRAGYGSNFRENILAGKTKAFESHSSSNGCIMRASPLLNLDRASERSKESILCTHNHPDSLVAFQWYWDYAHTNELPETYIDYEELCEVHLFDITALGTVRDAISVAEASCNVREAAIKSCFLGGDTDTIAAIACSLVAYRNMTIDKDIREFVENKITGEMLNVLTK